MEEAEDQSLSRPQRRMLRRIFNGRTTPVVADGRSFLTYKDAARHLQSLPAEAREMAYGELRENAKRAE
ncbi:MAG: hypothetical protein EOP83_33990 [Verrucomicrobiaceae bacterium]|nr:MAG: hypothetical protein EOP83_33990 [Verrucomicrobiaceae bacterium]